MKGSNLTTLRRTAAELLAVAALDQFPGTFLIGGEGSPLGFSYDFIFPFPFRKEFLPLLEERIRALIKEGREIEMKEMLPKNAALFFEHKQQPYLAKRAEAERGSLVQIFQIGDFFDLCPPPYLPATSGLGSFALTEAVALEDGVTRILGIAFLERSDLKKYLKSLKKYAESSHRILGGQMGLFSEYSEEGDWVWHPKGAQLVQQLLGWWRLECVKGNFSIIEVARELSEKERILLQKQFAPRSAAVVRREVPEGDRLPEGMLSPAYYIEPLLYLFYGGGDLAEISISSLQFITKISKILGFEGHFVLCTRFGRSSSAWKKGEDILEKAVAEAGIAYLTDEEAAVARGPRIELRVKDALNREWSVSYLEVDVENRCLVCSMFGSLERLVALLLEQKKGMLPFWLAPDQVRLFAVSHGTENFVRECANKLKKAGIRVSLEPDHTIPLGGRVYNALREKVPYCIFIGDRELKTGRVSVRGYGSTQDELMGLEPLIEKLIREQEGQFENQ